jgi:hypothetical protein
LNFDYIRIAPGYAREVLEAYEAWGNKGEVPMRVQELMMVLMIEVDKRYPEHAPPRKPEPKPPVYKDTKLAECVRSLCVTSRKTGLTA